MTNQSETGFNKREEHQAQLRAIKEAFSGAKDVLVILCKEFVSCVVKREERKSSEGVLIQLILSLIRNLLSIHEDHSSSSNLLQSLEESSLLEAIVLFGEEIDKEGDSCIFPLLLQIFSHLFGSVRDVDSLVESGKTFEQENQSSDNRTKDTTTKQTRNMSNSSKLNTSNSSKLGLLRKKEKEIKKKTEFEVSGRHTRFGGVLKQEDSIFQAVSWSKGDKSVNKVKSRVKKFLEDWNPSKQFSFHCEVLLFRLSLKVLNSFFNGFFLNFHEISFNSISFLRVCELLPCEMQRGRSL